MSRSTNSRKGSPSPEMSSDMEVSCPLCLEEMDSSDCRFKPCPCGYQICRFCWHRIREEGNERCPACRRIYTDDDIEFLPETEVTRLRTKKTEAKLTSVSLTTNTIPSTIGVLASRRHLVEIRVIQKNLVYVIGISAHIAHENILKDLEYFGQFGKIIKIVVNRRNTGAPLLTEKAATGGATTTSGSAYVTYMKAEEAARAISLVDGSVFDGRILRATYGTTKYCSFFLRGISCPNPGCMYLHEEGDPASSYTKEELSSGKLHLHSSLVDKAEEASLRQFGTIMYRPPVGRIVPSLPPTHISSTVAGQGEVGPPAAQRPEPKPVSPPINLALYENEALSFLNRLARWNPASDLDLDPPLSPRLEDAMGDENSTFDPFSEPSIRHKSNIGLNPPEVPASPLLDSHPAQTGPMISKGTLPGFDWTSLTPFNKPVLVGASSSFFEDHQQQPSVVTFRKPGGTKPTPVGSSANLPKGNYFGNWISPNSDYAAPLPVSPANLDHIFGYYQGHRPLSTEEGATARKALDASLLERQFFKDPQSEAHPRVGDTHDHSGLALAGPIKFNQIAAVPAPASVPMVVSPVSSTPQGSQKIQIMAKQPPRVLKREAKPKPEQSASDPSKEVYQTPISPTGHKKPVMMSSKEKTPMATPTTKTPSISPAPSQMTIPKSNLFALLEDDLSSFSEDEIEIEDQTKEDLKMQQQPLEPPKEVTIVKPKTSSKDESPKPPASALPTTANSRKKKQKKTETVASEETRVTRPTFPPLPSQQTYTIHWPSKDNNYASVRLPTFELMSDGERMAWRKWLEGDLKYTRQEEQILRAKVVKLHGEFYQWISNFPPVSSSLS